MRYVSADTLDADTFERERWRGWQMKRPSAWLLVGLISMRATPAWAGPSAEGILIALVGGLTFWLLGAAWTMLLAHLVGRSKACWLVVSLLSPVLAFWTLRLLDRAYEALGGRNTAEGFGFYAMAASVTAQFWLPTLGLLLATRLGRRREPSG